MSDEKTKVSKKWYWVQWSSYDCLYCTKALPCNRLELVVGSFPSVD